MKKLKCEICGSEDVYWEITTEIFKNENSEIKIPNFKVLSCNCCKNKVPTKESVEIFEKLNSE